MRAIRGNRTEAAIKCHKREQLGDLIRFPSYLPGFSSEQVQSDHQRNPP